MHRTITHIALLCLLAASLPATAGEIPDRPEKLSYPELSFDVPNVDAMRFELSNGTPVYAKEDTQFPLINLSLYFKGGEYIEPIGKEGLVAVASECWRTGGAGELSAQELDEELDFLAANLRTDIGEVTGSVSVNFLSKDLEKILPILMDVLVRPSFQEDRFNKAKDDLIQDLKTRNDHAASIESREWNRLIFGEGYWKNRLATKASVEAVTAEDCKTFIDSLIRSDNLVIAVAGDFDRAALTAALEKTVATLPKLDAAIPPVPQPDHSPELGVYVVHKEDVNQGRVSIGHIGYKEGHPEQFSMMLMNDVLGGGGFTAWMMKTVRSDEGLAYGAYSRLNFPLTLPGVFRATLQTKSSTVAYASEITMGLIQKMKTEGPAEDEIVTAKASFIETFPRRFESPTRTVGTFASGELLGRASDYWQTYRDRIAAVTVDSARASAVNYLHDKKMVMLVVGNLDEIKKGHPDHEATLADFGTIHELPLRDPLTLEPITD